MGVKGWWRSRGHGGGVKVVGSRGGRDLGWGVVRVKEWGVMGVQEWSRSR